MSHPRPLAQLLGALGLLLLAQPPALRAQETAAPPASSPSTSPCDPRSKPIIPGPRQPRHELDPRNLVHALPPLRANPLNPRMVAEWEPVSAALIAYPLGISVNTVKDIASELKVYVLCTASNQGSATRAFQAAGVNMANIAYITATTDTYWTRDYGPWWITEGTPGQRTVRMVDVVYRMNGERPNDDRAPVAIASTLKLPSYFNLSFVCQGGNVMTDAQKVGASTNRLQDENPGLGLSTLQQMGATTLGLNPYYVMSDPAYPADYIKHIDCWAKFISPTTVLVKRVPTTDSYYGNFEAAAAAWANRTNAAGQKYNVVRIDGTSSTPYVNHVILNDRVFVPILTSETDPTDRRALDQIRAAYGPGYRILPQKAAPTNPWLGTDSIHCRVNSIPNFTAIAAQENLGVLSITRQPQAQTVSEGAIATFTVEVTGGVAPYQYQWYRNHEPQPGATAATWTFAARAADSGATCHAVVTDSSPTPLRVTSTPALLTVTGQPLEKLVNGGFEQGSTGWGGTAGVVANWITYGEPSYEGLNAAYLGGNGRTATEVLYQTVTLPATLTQATLSFWLHISTKETGSTVYDTLTLRLKNSAGAVLKSLATYSNTQAAGGYQLRTFDVSAYKGQTIQIHFEMKEDSALSTSFLLDKASLLVK